MKLSDLKQILNEMPYHHGGEMKREPFAKTFMSDASLKRLYTMLGFVEVEDELVELHLLVGEDPCVKGTIKAKHPDGDDSNRVMFSLRFKHKNTLTKVPKGIDESRILQVDKASIDVTFQSQGIASYVYSVLAKRGFIVLSDSSQFTDGKMLWKRMTSKAELRDYTIYVLDSEYGFIEQDGKPLEYNGSNIDEAKIWTSGDDLSGDHILLMMT